MDNCNCLLQDIEARLDAAKEMHDKKQKLLQEFEKFNFLIQQRLVGIKKFSTQKLAEQLGCINCEDPREKIDWYTAENFLNRRFTDHQWFSLGRHELILGAYDCLRKKGTPIYKLFSYKMWCRFHHQYIFLHQSLGSIRLIHSQRHEI